MRSQSLLPWLPTPERAALSHIPSDVGSGDLQASARPLRSLLASPAASLSLRGPAGAGDWPLLASTAIWPARGGAMEHSVCPGRHEGCRTGEA